MKRKQQLLSLPISPSLDRICSLTPANVVLTHQKLIWDRSVLFDWKTTENECASNQAKQQIVCSVYRS